MKPILALMLIKAMAHNAYGALARLSPDRQRRTGAFRRSPRRPAPEGN
jgi:hypothetical protein